VAGQGSNLISTASALPPKIADQQAPGLVSDVFYYFTSLFTLRPLLDLFFVIQNFPIITTSIFSQNKKVTRDH